MKSSSEQWTYNSRGSQLHLHLPVQPSHNDQMHASRLINRSSESRRILSDSIVTWQIVLPQRTEPSRLIRHSERNMANSSHDELNQANRPLIMHRIHLLVGDKERDHTKRSTNKIKPIHLGESNHLSIYLSIYLSMALQLFVGPWPLLQFLDLFTQSVGFLGRVISPLQGRYLHTGQHKHRINAHNTDIYASNGIRTHDPSVWGGADSSWPRGRGHCDRLNRDN
jgi:hypothetical protein